MEFSIKRGALASRFLTLFLPARTASAQRSDTPPHYCPTQGSVCEACTTKGGVNYTQCVNDVNNFANALLSLVDGAERRQ